MSRTEASTTPEGWYPSDDHVERYWSGSAWTDQTRPRAAALSQPTTPTKKKRRVFLWVFLAVQVTFLIWIIAGASSGSGQPSDCGGLDADTCNAASDAGTAIGVVLIVVVWAVVDFFMAVIYGVYRLAKRS